MAPKHGRLKKAEKRHQSRACACMEPTAFDGHVHLDEWKHASGQPGGVQWGAGLRHQHCQLLAEYGNLLIALGIIRTDAHGKQDEQPAELQRVLLADLSVDGKSADESQRHLLRPQSHARQRFRELVHIDKE
eukprot:scaffold39593_cov60-Phaeocystis_antarctica.AAC.3